MAQELLYHIRLLQDSLGLPLTGGNVIYDDVDYYAYPDNNDPLHSDAKLREDIIRGVRWVIADIAKAGGWHIVEQFIAVTVAQNEYVIPKEVIAPLAIRFFSSGRWTDPVDIVDPDEFHSDYWDAYQGVYPEYATLYIAQGRALHVEGTVTTANAARLNPFSPILIDSAQNMGTTISGFEIDQNDYVFNDTDGSYGFVDYLDIITAKVSSGGEGTTVNGNVVTAAAIGAASPPVVVGDILQLADNSWSIITAISGNNATCSNKVHGDATSLSQATAGFNIGTSSQIVLAGGSVVIADASEALIGGAENDLDISDAYHIEARVPTLDVLKIRPAFNFTDVAGEKSMKLEYWGYPPVPIKPFHEVGLPDHYEQAIHTKSLEFTTARDTGISMPYFLTIKEIAKHRRIHNVKSGDRYSKMSPSRMGQSRYTAYQFNN